MTGVPRPAAVAKSHFASITALPECRHLWQAGIAGIAGGSGDGL
jgi:hypothetical protein